MSEDKLNTERDYNIYAKGFMDGIDLAINSIVKNAENYLKEIKKLQADLNKGVNDEKDYS